MKVRHCIAAAKPMFGLPELEMACFFAAQLEVTPEDLIPARPRWRAVLDQPSQPHLRPAAASGASGALPARRGPRTQRRSTHHNSKREELTRRKMKKSAQKNQ